jgi:two-component sensor histidine kinase
MLTMQARSASSEDVKAAVADARARIMTVARVHDRLWRGIDIGIVELREYLSDLFGDLAQSAPGVRLLHEVEELSLAADQAIPLALMTSELLTNAFKYACPGGEGDVRVTVTRCGERMLRVIVEDSGPGLPEGFDPLGESGSLGMRMIQGFVRQLNGSLRHASANPGARFEIDVPLQDQN